MARALALGPALMAGNERPPVLARLAERLQNRERRVFKSARRSAAVLVPLVRGSSGVDVLFTLRTDSVPTHKGQVAFPGGGVEDGDDSITATALRETEEELGIPRACIEVLGLGDDALSITGQRVTPVVGWVSALPELHPSAREIADIFTVPLEELMRPADFYEEELEGPAGERRHVPFFRGGKHTIWGLTAWILKELLTVVDGQDRGPPYHR